MIFRAAYESLLNQTQSPEAAVVQLFKEIRRHKPSVIFIPNVDVWYHTVPPAVIKTFTGLLQSLRPDEPVLVLGIMETSKDDATDPAMLRDLFGFSMKNVFNVQRPGEAARREYFEEVIKFIRMPPSDFPNQENRKKRQLAELPVAPQKKVEGPTKDQQKAQKKQDRITLNNLKVVIQPVMDQIKRAYKKFRTPIVDPAVIEYLFDEQGPNHVPADLPAEMSQQPGFYRPYELSRDEKGEPGLREVATGKFFYNLEIVMIEKRLSNGYYKRPRDFLADIKRLAKDARTSGDEERTLKANELVANVEVDMAMVERTNPDLVRECEAVYAREKVREKEALEKARKEAEATGQTMVVPSNIPPNISGNTTTDTTGPILLGEQVPGPPTIPPVTPLRNLASLSNGDTPHDEENSHALSNGEHPASHPNEDTPMTDAPHVGGEATSAPNTQTQQKSQRSAVTYLPPGSQPADYYNSASTTTSGQKTDKSNRSSGPYNNTQSTNGVSEHPDFSAMQPGGTQSIPDTQGTSSDSSSLDSPLADAHVTELSSLSQHTQSQPSQASSQHQNLRMGPPSSKPHNSTINALLNSDPPTPSQPALVIDEAHLKTLQQELTRRCSGLSVEQLEQVNATIMDTIWKQRNVWNRVQVAHTVQAAFNEVIEDIKLVQSLLPPSQKSQVIDPDEDGR
jgi:ATPase family AAA domain-containing protein 2